MAISVQTTQQRNPVLFAISRVGLLVFSIIFDSIRQISWSYRRFRTRQELMNLPSFIRADIGIEHLSQCEIDKIISKNK